MREIRLETMPVQPKKPVEVEDTLGIKWRVYRDGTEPGSPLVLVEEPKGYDEEKLLVSLQKRLEAIAGAKVSRVLRDVVAVLVSSDTSMQVARVVRSVVVKATVVGFQRMLVVEIFNWWEIPMAFQFGLPDRSDGTEELAAGQVVSFLGTVVPHTAKAKTGEAAQGA